MKQVSIIGVPMDLGANRRGVDMGPSALRYTGIQERLGRLGYRVADLGNLAVPVAESRPPRDEPLKYLSEVVKVCRLLARAVERSVAAGAFPLVLGGDHSIAIGTLAGVTRKRPDTGVIWLDAHGDFNTDRSTPSGNIHGMALAVSLGLGAAELVRARGDAPLLKASRVALVGARTLDRRERGQVLDAGINVFTMHEVDKFGMREVVARALERVGGGDGLHLSLDVDVLDPSEAPGVGTPHRGGLTYREAMLAMELIAESGLLRSLEVVEVNPVLDVANRTAEVAADLVSAALGERIL